MYSKMYLKERKIKMIEENNQEKEERKVKKEKKEKKEKQEKKIKIDKQKLIGRIIASIMVIILLLGSFYSLIYILINNK